MGQRYANNTNTVHRAGVLPLRRDGGLQDPTYDVRLNVFNLTDVKYYDQLMASDGGRAVPGSGLTAMLTLTSACRQDLKKEVLVCIPNVLDAAQLEAVRERLDRAGDAWVDGLVTAGYQGAPVKLNQQIDERSDVALDVPADHRAGAREPSAFISAVLPNIVYPPMFNRYSEGMKFGAHVDGGVRIHPHDGRKLRTDISATLFLTNPGLRRRRAADRGHLRPPQHQAGGGRHGGLSGHQPAQSHADHARRAASCFFWVQSLIRDDQQRALLSRWTALSSD